MSELSLVLASRSPQRRAILEQLGISFRVVTPDVEELVAGPAEAVAIENARRKAAAVAPRAGDSLVLGVDTIVCLDERIYGKPRSEGEAGSTLRALAGRVHTVISGICVAQGDQVRITSERTEVEFRPLDEPLLEWYLSSGEWRERAGGYAIQGRGAALVARISGDFFNVVGLPVAALLELAPEIVG